MVFHRVLRPLQKHSQKYQLLRRLKIRRTQVSMLLRARVLQQGLEHELPALTFREPYAPNTLEFQVLS
uniref:Uncharacterized protein n=1 Tax=Physcomitrium patens TaxID=3218 RepID=A0A2K1L736_PHYPA|nr:hypothetical protein PHYPA_000225 [Physcomitrium patens]